MKNPYALPLVVFVLATAGLLAAGPLLASAAVDPAADRFARSVTRLGIPSVGLVLSLTQQWIDHRRIRDDRKYAAERLAKRQRPQRWMWVLLAVCALASIALIVGRFAGAGGDEAELAEAWTDLAVTLGALAIAAAIALAVHRRTSSTLDAMAATADEEPGCPRPAHAHRPPEGVR